MKTTDARVIVCGRGRDCDCECVTPKRRTAMDGSQKRPRRGVLATLEALP